MNTQEKEYIKVKTTGYVNVHDIASEYGMLTKELIVFHNQYCGLSEILPLELPKYVEFIYLPVDRYTNRQEKLLQHTKLELPSIEIIAEYGVIIDFCSQHKQLHYIIRAHRLHRNLVLSRRKFFVNNKEINKVAEQIFEKADQALYPLKISLNDTGSLQKLENAKEIYERWSTEYFPSLKEYYVGNIAEEVLDKLDNTFRKLETKKEYLYNSLFYKLFFLPIYHDYYNYSNCKTIHVYFSEIRNYISYNVSFNLEKEYGEGNRIILRLIGEEEENFSNENRKKGNLDLVYQLDKKTHEIHSIVGYLSTYNTEKELKIEFQLYKPKNS